MFIKNCIELRRIECLDFPHLRGTLRASRGWLEVPDHVASGTGLQDFLVACNVAGCCMGMGWQGTWFFFNSETPTMAFCNCNAVRNQNSKNERFAILRLKHTAFRSTGGWRRNRHFLASQAPWPLHQSVITFIITYRRLGPRYWRQVRVIFCHLPLATIFPRLCKVDQFWLYPKILAWPHDQKGQGTK